MKTCPPPPRSSAIGPLGTTSYTERSVTCVHCQKVHDRGFIWNFSETLRVCFTCYRTMGDDGRKSYERKAAKEKPKQTGSSATEPQATAPKAGEPTAHGSTGSGYAVKVACLLAFLIVLLGAGACYVYKPLSGELAERRASSSESRMPLRR